MVKRVKTYWDEFAADTYDKPCEAAEDTYDKPRDADTYRGQSNHSHKIDDDLQPQT